MLFAGFFANRDSINPWVRWLEYLSPMKYYFEMVITNEYGGRDMNPSPVDTIYNFEFGIGKCIIVLILFSLVARFLGYIALKGLLKSLE